MTSEGAGWGEWAEGFSGEGAERAASLASMALTALRFSSALSSELRSSSLTGSPTMIKLQPDQSESAKSAAVLARTGAVCLQCSFRACSYTFISHVRLYCWAAGDACPGDVFSPAHPAHTLLTHAIVFPRRGFHQTPAAVTSSPSTSRSGTARLASTCALERAPTAMCRYDCFPCAAFREHKRLTGRPASFLHLAG